VKNNNQTKHIIFAFFLLASCGKNNNYTTDYIPYNKIPLDYSLDNAKADGLVVYENGSITAGQSVWDEFVSNTENGVSAMVRLAFYYTINEYNYAPELYEEIKDKYPCLYIQDLSFDGKKYRLYSIEDGKEYIHNYKYLKRLEENSPPDSAIFHSAVYYYLLNDPDVTYERIRRGFFSSRFGDAVDCKNVYSKVNYKR
jgi:hypothetical protein